MRRSALLAVLALSGWLVFGLLSARSSISQTGAGADSVKASYTGNEACAECHDAEYTAYQGGAHGRSARDGEAVGLRANCETCHGPGSEHVAADGDTDDPRFWNIRRFDPKHAKDAEASCVGCHKAGEQFMWEHGPHAAKGVSCIECHSMHSPKDPGGLALLREETPTRTCETCHRAQSLKLRRSEHMPLMEGGMECTDCHNPHGTASERQLRAENTSELCTSCHADKRGPMLWEHPPVRENCMNCHEPHGSNQKHLLVARSPYLCQRCHQDARHPGNRYDEYQRQIDALQLVNKGCVNCHVSVHGSNHPSGELLLR
jgi:DmsE family decaheme c-type cytochrome